MNAEPELDDLDSSLICSVCLDLLFDPYVTVPCNHTFCETCLRRIGSKEPMNTQCPMCRQRINYCEPQNGNLKVVLILSTMYFSTRAYTFMSMVFQTLLGTFP